MSDNKPQKGISEISEITVFDVTLASRNFFTAVGWGSLAGTLALTVPILLVSESVGSLTDVALGICFIGVVVVAFTLAGMLLIGLPVTALLRALNEERQMVYAAIGALAGFAIIAVLFELYRYHSLEMFLLPVSGGVAGFAAAWRWGRWRDQLSASALVQVPGDEALKPSNPIHDLIH